MYVLMSSFLVPAVIPASLQALILLQQQAAASVRNPVPALMLVSVRFLGLVPTRPVQKFFPAQALLQAAIQAPALVPAQTFALAGFLFHVGHFLQLRIELLAPVLVGVQAQALIPAPVSADVLIPVQAVTLLFHQLQAPVTGFPPFLLPVLQQLISVR